MREYGGEINCICLEAQTLAKKRFSLNVLFVLHCAIVTVEQQ